MTVTEVAPLDKRRCKVSLDGDFAFVLYKGEWSRLGADEGSELGETAYREIMEEILPRRARERACYLLKARDYTETEILRKLREGGYPEQIRQDVLCFLKEYRYIDDESYAERYIETYKDKKSQKRIHYELLQKGIPDDLLERLLEENPCDEEDQIRKWLEKKRLDPQNLDAGERRKAMMALARKGISWDAIQRIFHP